MIRRAPSGEVSGHLLRVIDHALPEQLVDLGLLGGGCSDSLDFGCSQNLGVV